MWRSRSQFRALAILLVLVSACSIDETRFAPQKAETPWPIPSEVTRSEQRERVANELPSQRTAFATPTIDLEQSYSLPGLIDLAQRNSPLTRDAWERARIASAQLGLVESTYLPQISADAIAGIQRTPLPIPANLVPQGYFTSDTREVLPSVAVKWLLFDFGRRAGAMRFAKEQSFVANVNFTGAHQKLAYAVSRNYYTLNAIRGQTRALEQSLRAAQIDQDAVDTRRRHGLATTVEQAQAIRQTAQAQFNLTRSQGAEQNAYATLISSIGLLPTVALNVADASNQELPLDSAETLDHFIDSALTNRPEVLSSIGQARAAEANLQKQSAEHHPSITLVTSAYQNVGELSSQGSPYYRVDKPGWAVFLQFSWPLFDGGQRRAKESVARSELNEARDAILQARISTAKDVSDAYYALKTSIAEHTAASALVSAAVTAHDSELDAYKQGVGTYTDLVNGENALAQANEERESAIAHVRIAAVELAFATGALAPNPTQSP